MSPTIMRELLAIKRTLTTCYAAPPDASKEDRWDAMEREYERITLFRDAGIRATDRYDAVKVLKGSLPYRRSCEESEREHEAEMAAGGRTICPKCGERSVTNRTVCTYGYRGHPGADYSAFYECENEACDYADLAG